MNFTAKFDVDEGTSDLSLEQDYSTSEGAEYESWALLAKVSESSCVMNDPWGVDDEVPRVRR